MNESISMSVSSMTRNGEEKAIYILFTDGDKTAEFTMPEVKAISNSGFTREEMGKLREYVENEQDYIYSIAKKVDPMKNFLGEWK